MHNNMTDSASENLRLLQGRLRRIEALDCASQVLVWDQATYMPDQGGSGRGRQLAALGTVVHEQLIDPELGRLLQELHPVAEDLPDGDPAKVLINVARRDQERAACVPTDFTAEFVNHQSDSFEVWKKARPANDFEAVRPMLEKTLDFSRRYANFFPGYQDIADPLIADWDQGLTTSWIRALFAELKEQLIPLVNAVCERPKPDHSCLRQNFPKAGQLAFGCATAKRLGYDFGRGRQDETHHPFMIRFGHGDIRITTRVEDDNICQALFGTIHESGHAMYEQGIAAELDGLPTGHGVSNSVHESQSRLWENIVARSLPFWQHFFPILQDQFTDLLGGTGVEEFHRAINRVERSLIRTDSDELTYNLHIMMRFELEVDLLEGRVEVKDLPRVWHERMVDYLGVEPPNDANGVMQDVHWYCGKIGGEFQGYAIGNVMSAQFYAAALEACPDVPEEIAAGRFDRLLAWLTDNVYRHGRSVEQLALVEQATGEPLSIRPYMDYLTEKYSTLYDL
jgi:carboxypeptidase Taq